MSDSDDLSTPANIPADSAIEQCLRQIVHEAVKTGNDITTNLARSRAEKDLGLYAGFFKDNEVWKKRSKDVISSAVEDPETPEKPKPKPKPAAKAGTKRKSDEVVGGRKRVKKSPVVDSEDVIEGSERSEVGHVLPKPHVQPKDEDESALSEPPDDELESAAVKTNGKPAEDDESDLSSVIDDAPPKKKRQKKSTSPSATKSKPAKSSKSSKPDTKPAKDLSPDEEQIKQLQSWLLKCGIRKLWHRELAPFSTSKEKIKHLKGMLDEVGMTGRYSTEKAKSIKEARELKAELEAAREFNEQWGHESGDEEDEKDGGGEKKEEVVVEKRRPKGLVDFGDSDEGSD